MGVVNPIKRKKKKTIKRKALPMQIKVLQIKALPQATKRHQIVRPTKRVWLEIWLKTSTVSVMRQEQLALPLKLALKKKPQVLPLVLRPSLTLSSAPRMRWWRCRKCLKVFSIRWLRVWTEWPNPLKICL